MAMSTCYERLLHDNCMLPHLSALMQIQHRKLPEKAQADKQSAHIWGWWQPKRVLSRDVWLSSSKLLHVSCCSSCLHVSLGLGSLHSKLLLQHRYLGHLQQDQQVEMPSGDSQQGKPCMMICEVKARCPEGSTSRCGRRTCQTSDTLQLMPLSVGHAHGQTF